MQTDVKWNENSFDKSQEKLKSWHALTQEIPQKIL
jgi:hypothetical protein